MSIRTSPITCLITTGRATPSDYNTSSRAILSVIQQAVDDGVSMVQIREKHLGGRSLYDLVSGAVTITRATGTKLLINDRADIALAAGADGVQLGGRSLPISAARRSFPAHFIISASVHSADEASKASAEGADQLVLGPVFETPGKPHPIGIDVFTDICTHVPTPVLAIGGIDEDNCRSVIASGAAGIAAIRALNTQHSRKRIVAALASIGVAE